MSARPMAVLVFLGFALLLRAQDPYQVAPDHYHLTFENEWVRATRVTYAPHDKAPVHAHPPTPTTVYVYVTDGGPIRFVHVTGEHVAGVQIVRKAVQAGAIRFCARRAGDTLSRIPRRHPDRVRAYRTPNGATGPADTRRAFAASRARLIEIIRDYGIRERPGAIPADRMRRRRWLSAIRTPGGPSRGGDDVGSAPG